MSYLKDLGLPTIYVGVQGVALVLAFPFIHAGLQQAATPNSPTSIIPLLIAIIVAPLLIILFAKKASNSLGSIRFLFTGVICVSILITLQPAIALLLPLPIGFSSGLSFDPSIYIALFVASMCFLALLLEPQWYVVDSVGFLAGGALTALLGIFIGILWALVFLSILMVYDAIAVYWTKHMISLADVVSDMKLPIMMVMPSEASFDYTRVSLKDHRDKVKARPEEREALFMGLGDAVIPGVLVVSSYVFLPQTRLFGWLPGGLLTAFCVMAGSLVGYMVLMRAVASGNPQAGLPFLNGGAIAGFLLSYPIIFHSFSYGITWP
jgi:presenilin-like A22 family membrane protease